MTVALIVITSALLLLTARLVYAVHVLHRDLDVLSRIIGTLARSSLPPDVQAELLLDEDWRRIGGGT